VKYYAIKRPDGSWIMVAGAGIFDAWERALGIVSSEIAAFEAAGYTCAEVSGFVEVGK
jgi:hypothetical protein